MPAASRGIARNPLLVVEVRVSEELFEQADGLIHDGRVYVELYQGGMQQQTEGGVEPRFSLDDWREAIPVGTRVMLFLLDRDYAEVGGFETEHEGRGRPDGATLLMPDPQGMIFEYDGELVAQDFDVAAAWWDGCPGPRRHRGPTPTTPAVTRPWETPLCS